MVNHKQIYRWQNGKLKGDEDRGGGGGGGGRERGGEDDEEVERGRK
jgi:hypothetical protein